MLKVGIFDDFLDPNLLKQISEWSLSIPYDHCYTNHNIWPSTVVNDSDCIYLKRINSDVPTEANFYKQVCNAVTNKLEYTKHLNFSISIHYCTQGAHIPWHNDGSHKHAITIFLNSRWDRNNGGLFLFEDVIKNEIKAVVPTFNRAIELTGGVLHAVTATTKTSPIRRSIQIFID